jgi:hypothetical protein
VATVLVARGESVDRIDFPDVTRGRLVNEMK